MDEAEVANRNAAQLGVFFALRGFQKFRRVARKEKRLQQFAAHRGRTIRAIQLLQFVLRVHEAKLADSFPLYLIVFFTLGRLEQVLAIAPNHVRAQDGPLDRRVGSSGINLRQSLAGLRSTEHGQILNGFALQVGIALAPRDPAQNLARLRRAALSQNKQRLRLFLRRGRAVLEYFSQQRHRSLRVAVHKPTNRKQAKVIILLSFRMNRLAGRLTHFQVQRVGISQPATLWEPVLELGNVSQRGISLAQAILRIGLPIKGRVGLRAVHLGQLVEPGFSAVIAVFIQRFAAVVIKFGQAIEPFLLAVLLFLFPVARFFFAIALFLLAISGFLVLILTILFHIVGCFVAVCVRACLTPRRGNGLRSGRERAARSRSTRCNTRHRQQKRHYNPGSVSHHRCISLAHTLFLSPFAEPFGVAGVFPDSSRCCSSLPTTRTLKRMPRASMRCRMPSSCAGVTCCGLCATSRRTRSSSSSTSASPESPCSSAVCRYSRFSSSKSSARRCSPEMLTSFCSAVSGPLFASSTKTISERPRCSPTAMTRMRSRTSVWSTATGAPELPGRVRRPAINAANTSAAIAPAAAQRRGANHGTVFGSLKRKSHQWPRRCGRRGEICCQTRWP